MNRLVVIRVGDLDSWNTYSSLGRWSSPELHAQIARNLFVEGYTVIGLFVGRGDIPLAAARITNIRERRIEDSVFPARSDLGDLRTFLEFNPQTMMNLDNGFTVTYQGSLQYIRYMIGSQVHIPHHLAREFLNYFLIMSNASTSYRGNVTYGVSDSLQGPAPLPNLQNHVNFII